MHELEVSALVVYEALELQVEVLVVYEALELQVEVLVVCEAYDKHDQQILVHAGSGSLENESDCVAVLPYN